MLPPSGPDDCPLCHDTLRRCPQKYEGLNCKPTTSTFYGFQWRFNSCFIDGPTDCMMFVFKNLSGEGVRIYVNGFADFAAIFRNLIEGRICTWPAKKQLELAISARLWTEEYQLKYPDCHMRKHKFCSPGAAMSVLSIPLVISPGAAMSLLNIPLVMGEDTIPVFTIKCRVLVSCPSCNTVQHTEDITSESLYLELLCDRHDDWMKTALDSSMANRKGCK